MHPFSLPFLVLRLHANGLLNQVFYETRRSRTGYERLLYTVETAAVPLRSLLERPLLDVVECFEGRDCTQASEKHRADDEADADEPVRSQLAGQQEDVYGQHVQATETEREVVNGRRPNEQLFG